ncbi:MULTISPECIES: hypothetical protein [unclassified Cyanobium]|nr:MULTISPECIES: hypothetical protein [unclassified Cyanobium]
MFPLHFCGCLLLSPELFSEVCEANLDAVVSPRSALIWRWNW